MESGWSLCIPNGACKHWAITVCWKANVKCSKPVWTSDLFWEPDYDIWCHSKISHQLVIFFWLNAGTPKIMTTEAQTLSVCLHCTVDIPSNLHVSALNAQEVIWFRIAQSVTEELENAQINSDYSLTLTHIEKSDGATYFVRATNTNGESAISPHVNLMVIKKPGEKFYCQFRTSN